MSILFFANWLALLISFFVVGCIVGAVFSKPFRKKIAELVGIGGRKDGELARVSCNPILAPGEHPWSAEAVLNPAAVVLAGRTHLVYRAVGMDGVSRLGYASSKNGFVFDERLPYPIYVATDLSHQPKYGRQYSPHMYPSGGSWGGCEDPRMVALEGRVYVTFNMFENWALRVGVVSMSEADFLAKRFDCWVGPFILSHGSRHKNWVLFPEKIRGQFAVLHSVIGDDANQVRVAYTDDLATLAQQSFVSPDPQLMPDEAIAWHVHVRSAGPPPVRTDKGWLVFYHAHAPGEWNRYKLGAMLLDLDDPTKILYRSAHPVLVPDEWYENRGKPGIVYACGAVVRDGMLYLYYGGGDKVVCVAFASLAPFLKALMRGKETKLVSKPLKTK